MENRFIKHLVECQCISPLYKKQTNIIYHKFQVFSEFDGDDLIEKYVSCNNCNAIHRVYDACKSDVLIEKEEYINFVTTKEDIKLNLSAYNLNNLIEVLEKNDCDISVWEHCLFCYENDIEDTKIVFLKKQIDNITFNIKYLTIINKNFIVRNELLKTGFKI